jgi:hypothetical protein
MVMIRVADDMLALHLEVALATASPALLNSLADCDRRRRHAAIGEIARQLVERLRCFDIRSEDAFAGNPHPALFPDDPRPMG